MIPVINDIDKLLQAAPSRYGEIISRELRLSASALTFEIALDASISPAQIVFIASMLGLEGTAAFSTDDGTPLSVDGNTATLTPGAMIDKACIVTATMIVQGEQFVAKQAVLKVLAFDPSMPPAPAGLATLGKLASIQLNWTPTNNSNIAKVEIWRSLTDSLGEAVPVGATAGLASTFTDNIGAAGSFFYWIRYISKANVIGLFNAVSGTAGASGTDATLLLSLLQDRITESQLYGALRSRINLVDATGTGLVDRVAALTTTYGDTVASAASAAAAAQSASDAVAAKSAAILAAGDSSNSATAANTSKLAAESANTAAGTSASAAFTSAGNASTSATNAGTAASAANTSKLAAEAAGTAAGSSAAAAATSASNASTYATNAGTAAAASNTSKLAAEAASGSAQGAASAAVSARDTAVASATSAGTSASSASTSANTATTKAGEASTSASGAASSATGAAGSATNAATSATTAATARDAAGGSATAAAGSATSAGTQATNAGNSATAANTAKVAAESARDSAAGSASAAATSASTASTKASEAGASATSASSSANTANAGAAAALTYRDSAATSASNAAGSASAAATDYTAVNARLNNVSGSGATVEQKFTATADSITGLSGQLTWKIDVNGYVTGIGLASTAKDGATTSEVIINAANFAIVAPGASPKHMFTLGLVNGATAVGLGGVSILDDAVTARSIDVDTLSAITANLGNAVIDTAGSLRSGQTAYNTGTGYWFGMPGGVPKMSIGIQGVSGMRWDGTKLIIENPTVSSSFSATITNSLGQYYWSVGRNVNGAFAGTYNANPSNGGGTYTYSWGVSSGSNTVRAWISGSPTSSQISLLVYGAGYIGEFDFYITCTVTDVSGNVSKTITQVTTVDFT